MYFCVYLFTKELPNDRQINEVMDPYYESSTSAVECPNRNLRLYSLTVGGRYGGMLKLKGTDQEDDEYRWNFYTDIPRAGRLFRSELIEHLHRFARENRGAEYGFYSTEYIEHMCFLNSGLRDGYIHVDGCKVSDLYNLDEISSRGFGFVDIPFGKNLCREDFEPRSDEKYEKELKAALDRNRDNYITVLDCLPYLNKEEDIL